MSRYNWEELKKEFMLGDYKSLKEFAESKGLKYNGTFRKKTSGWLVEKRQKEDKKVTKIIEKTIEKIAERESDRNVAHLKLWDEFLYILQEALDDKENLLNKQGRISAYVLEKFANVMEKAQKGQRLALGLDEKQEQDNGSIDALVEAIRKSRDEEK